MNEQLTIPREARVWRIDPNTRQRGRVGVAEAREVLRRSRSKSITPSEPDNTLLSDHHHMPDAA